MTVNGILRETEEGAIDKGATSGQPPVPTITRVDTRFVAAAVNREVGTFYVQQTEATADGFKPVPSPDITEGSHFSYALQWIAFALVVALGWATLVYRAMREDQV